MTERVETRAEGGRPEPSDSEKGVVAKKHRPGVLFLLLGVIFPFSVVILEFATRICAQEFFDPIPTIWHTFLVFFVPSANLLVWYTARYNVTRHLRLVRLANGAAIGVSFYYTLLFAPLMPIALIAVLFAVGTLPLAPLASLVAAIKGYSHLRRMAQREEGNGYFKPVLIGLGMALLAIVILDLPATLTRVGMKMAISIDGNSRERGIKLLRILGSEDVMLRSCYQRMGTTMDLISLLAWRGHPVSPSKAREIYYRVTGAAYNSVPPPSCFRTGRLLSYQPGFDPDQGGDRVGGRVQGVALAGSRLDGSVDSDAALAYLQWTLEFANDSIRRQEARCLILLPPGAVVSRLTLWIDGEEREAAFAGRSRVRTAYQRVVRKRRDPVLVTTSGPDRILVQCFPVEPHGGKMKVRLGITVPLKVSERSDAYLCLPSFVERNFRIDEDTRHLVWIESKERLESRSDALKGHSTGERFELRGQLTSDDLASPQSVVQVHRKDDVVSHTWARDTSGTGRLRGPANTGRGDGNRS